MSAADEKTGLRRGQNRCADFFRRNEKTFLTFVLFSDKIHLACGGIAQLGERLNGIQEVSGSIPLISTKSREIYSISRLFLYFLHKKLLWSCSRTIQACLLDLLYFT